MASLYKIDDTYGGLTSLDALGISANPRSSYRAFSDAIRDANGLTHGMGYPVAEWHWDVMKPGEADILEAFLNGALSAAVYITTKINRLDNSDQYQYATFSAVMNWPTGDEDVQARRELGLTITFTHLILIPDET
jgi:hypothetical protein